MEKGKGLASYPGNAQNMGIKLVEKPGERGEGKRSLGRGEREREA